MKVVLTVDLVSIKFNAAWWRRGISLSSSQSTELHILQSNSLFGHSKELMGPNLFDFLIQAHKNFGPFIQLKVPGRKLVSIGNATLARELISQETHLGKGILYKKLKHLLGEGLLTSEEDISQKHREAMKSIFTPQGTQEFFPVMVESTRRKIDLWESQGQEHMLDVGDEMRRLTLEIIVQSLLGTSISKEQGDIARALHTALELIAQSSNKWFSLPKWIPTRHNIRLNFSLSQVRKFIQSLETSHFESRCPLKQIAAQANWSKKEFTDEAINLLFAGHETTSQALTWSFIHLNQYPDWLFKIRKEWEDQSFPSSIADLNRFQMTKAFVQETLRLRSPVPCFAKVATANIQLGNVEFKKGTVFLVMVRVIHRDPTDWGPTALDFDPMRFLDSPTSLSHRAFMPFSLGRRSCLGLHFAQSELAILMGLISGLGTFHIQAPKSIQEKFTGTLTTSIPVQGFWRNIQKA